MKIDPQILEFLRGSSFRNDFTFEFEKSGYPGISRASFITQVIEGKDVIHIGCSDHIQIIDEKLKSNTWLHKLITEKAKNCIGIDIDKESIDYIKNKLGYQNVYQGDIITDKLSIINDRKWDYVVFGEIIEHLDNPGSFLRTFKERFGTSVLKFIITVPNVYTKNQFGNMLKFKEIINSDHRFWFTPYTILKILVSAGFKPEEISFANLQKLNTYELALRKVRRLLGFQIKFPFYYFNSIIVSGEMN